MLEGRGKGKGVEICNGSARGKTKRVYNFMAGEVKTCDALKREKDILIEKRVNFGHVSSPYES